MAHIDIESFALGRWVAPGSGAREIASAVTGETVARIGSDGLDYAGMLDFARERGGPALRAMTFHDRARLLKRLAAYLDERKDELYALSHATGATLADAKVDVDGGIGTAFVFASKGRRELPDDLLCLDGEVEQLSRGGGFLGQHVYTAKHGVALHINAFNFPVWGMLEKLAPTLLSGMPAIVKPATATSYVAHACCKLIVESAILPSGSVQMIAGGVGDIFERLTGQDVVSFTGSAGTAVLLKSNRHLLEQAVPFIAEQDSLNASVLGPDVKPGAPEFDLFVDEVCREMTVKCGQKCTAIRRIFALPDSVDAVIEAVSEELMKVRIGDPALATTTMGALASLAQRSDVLKKVQAISQSATCVFGEGTPEVEGASVEAGAFVTPKLFRCDEPERAHVVHNTEVFGPVATVMPYENVAHACRLLNMGGGSLVASVITGDSQIAREVTLAAGAFHGRLYFNNRDSMREATGHGAPLPHMLHGGPGRAGGGEELGGIRAVFHYMQRTAIQGSPDILSGVSRTFVPGATELKRDEHPFRRSFSELEVGETLHTDSRVISIEDIEHFAEFTGDTFYAHMDEEAAAANPFFPGRVAHGYLLIAFAAGLFVDPAPGPVLANTGLHELSFQKPVVPGDSIKVTMTVKRKTKRNEHYGEVRWLVRLSNQRDEQVASYELHTMNAY